MFHKRRKQDLDEELRTYFDMSVETKMRAGMSEDEAKRATRMEMGSMDSVKEDVRDSTWQSVFGDLWQDLRYGLRQLRRSPGFTVIAIPTLALGLGANTAIFTLIHGVILKQLPVSNPSELSIASAPEKTTAASGSACRRRSVPVASIWAFKSTGGPKNGSATPTSCSIA